MREEPASMIAINQLIGPWLHYNSFSIASQAESELKAQDFFNAAALYSLFGESYFTFVSKSSSWMTSCSQRPYVFMALLIRDKHEPAIDASCCKKENSEPCR